MKVKHLLLVFMLMLSMGAIAQTTSLQRDTLMLKARLMLLERSRSYNPAGAYEIYSKKAWEGNAEAMNALGMMYIKGTGTAMNEPEGLIWITKAAQTGNAKALHNLGLLHQQGIATPKQPTLALQYFEQAARAGHTHSWYSWGSMVKDGEGTAQDFAQALEIFKEGAIKGDGGSMYGVGYFYYKGLGCRQDYEKAIPYFKQGAVRGSTGSMYMLGLAYRNGYGVTINADSSRYWLTKVAAMGDKRAIEELAKAETENNSPVAQKTARKVEKGQATITKGEIPQQHIRVKQQATKDGIAGEYTGYLIRYDWSGQNVISRTALNVKLSGENGQLIGEWVEKEGDAAIFEASLTDSALVFSNSKIERTDHYNSVKPVSYEFKEARLQLVRTADSVYLAGNLQLYGLKSKEPERPMYISLVRKEKQDNIVTSRKTMAANKTANLERATLETLALSEFSAYPNPFFESFTVSFGLQETTDISLQLADITGRILLQESHKKQPAGYFLRNIQINAPAGTYILRVGYNKEVKTTVLIKQ